MSDAKSACDRVQWRERLPWLILLKVFRPAISARMLLCSATGLLATISGWRVCWHLFAGSSDPLITRLHTAVGPGNVWPAWPWASATAGQVPFGHEGIIDSWANVPIVGHAVADIGAKVTQITLPFQLLFSQDSMGTGPDAGIGLPGLAFLLLCGTWAIAMWAFFGGILTRTAALRLAREETISWQQAGNFTRRHCLSYFTAPLYPLAGIFLTTLPILVLGLIMRWSFGAFVVGLVFWPLALIGGFFMALLLLGLFFGWPLMWSTISVEGTDAFDALSRSYAYVFQRPLHYLFYAFVAAVLGTLGWFVVDFFAEGVIHLTFWAASWGAGNAHINLLRDPEITKTGFTNYAAALIAFWGALVRLIAAGYVLSYFWTATTGIYLLLRRDVDGAEMDEVYLDQADESFGLPPLTADDKGVPGAADQSTDPVAGQPAVASGENLKDEE